MKYEWKATKKILLPLNLTIVLITLMGCVFLGTDILQSESSIPLVVLLIVLYALSMVALCLASNIYLLIRFYKNLFSNEGYLMFTLPVNPVQLLNSKLIVAYIWSFFNALLTYISIFALTFSSSYYSAIHGDSNSKSTFLSRIISSIAGDATDSASFQEVFGYSELGFLFQFTIYLLISAFFSLTMGYFAIILGQLIEKYKLASSIAFYIVLYVSSQLISTITLIAINLSNITSNSLSSLELTRSIYSTIFPTSSISSLILGILFYVATLFIIRKKINLD